MLQKSPHEEVLESMGFIDITGDKSFYQNSVFLVSVRHDPVQKKTVIQRKGRRSTGGLEWGSDVVYKGGYIFEDKYFAEKLFEVIGFKRGFQTKRTDDFDLGRAEALLNSF